LKKKSDRQRTNKTDEWKEKGKIKSKGTPASAPISKKGVETLSEKGEKFKNDLAFQKEVLYDDVDDAAKLDYKLSVEQKLEANELMADFGDEEFVERVKILKDFIKSLK
jgi:hypothetical protein